MDAGRLPLPAEEAERIYASMGEIEDGRKPPRPTECVVNSTRPPDIATSAPLLPIPPHFPDEVIARLWTQGRGYRMAPATVCPLSVVQAAKENAPQPTNTPAPEDAGE